MKLILNARYEFVEIDPDFVMGENTCALLLKYACLLYNNVVHLFIFILFCVSLLRNSLKYHRQYPMTIFRLNQRKFQKSEFLSCSVKPNSLPMV